MTQFLKKGVCFNFVFILVERYCGNGFDSIEYLFSSDWLYFNDIFKHFP